jgi:mannose-6-phosphate isomerase-like protein (cupin superfamily)
MSVAIERGMRLHNAFNKETFVFSGPVDDPAVARFDVVLEQGGTGGGNALLHIHPYAEEHFSIRSGQIKVVVEDKEHVVGPGESFVTGVCWNKPHRSRSFR